MYNTMDRKSNSEIPVAAVPKNKIDANADEEVMLVNSNMSSISELRSTIRTAMSGYSDVVRELAEALTYDLQAERPSCWFVSKTKNVTSVHGKVPRRNGILELLQVTLTKNGRLVIIKII